MIRREGKGRVEEDEMDGGKEGEREEWSCVGWKVRE